MKYRACLSLLLVLCTLVMSACPGVHGGNATLIVYTYYDATPLCGADNLYPSWLSGVVPRTVPNNTCVLEPQLEQDCAQCPKAFMVTCVANIWVYQQYWDQACTSVWDNSPAQTGNATVCTLVDTTDRWLLDCGTNGKNGFQYPGVDPDPLALPKNGASSIRSPMLFLAVSFLLLSFLI